MREAFTAPPPYLFQPLSNHLLFIWMWNDGVNLRRREQSLPLNFQSRGAANTTVPIFHEVSVASSNKNEASVLFILVCLLVLYGLHNYWVKANTEQLLRVTETRFDCRGELPFSRQRQKENANNKLS